MCGKPLPPPHWGRGKQKEFCNATCRAMLRYWKKFNPATNGSRLVKQHLNRFGQEYVPAEISDVQAAWLAAAIDSEGFISLNVHQRKGQSVQHFFPVLGVCNNDSRYIGRVAEWVGAEVTTIRERKTPMGYRTLKVITVSRIAIAGVLERVKPFLIVKQRQAEIVIQFCRAHDDLKVRAAYPEWFRDAFDEMRQLNKRGLRPELLEA
jgi:hypothetical protein